MGVFLFTNKKYLRNINAPCEKFKGLHICNEVSHWWFNKLDVSESVWFDGKISDDFLRCCISNFAAFSLILIYYLTHKILSRIT